jgi:serine/threonine protein phosphatase PrpC
MDPVGDFLGNVVSKGAEIVSEMPLGGSSRLGRGMTLLTLSGLAIGILLYKNHQEKVAQKNQQQLKQIRIPLVSTLSHSKTSPFQPPLNLIRGKLSAEEKTQETHSYVKKVPICLMPKDSSGLAPPFHSLFQQGVLPTSLPPIRRSDFAQHFEEKKESLDLEMLKPTLIPKEQSVKELNSDEIYKHNRRLVLDEKTVQEKLAKNFLAAQEGLDDHFWEDLSDWWQKANYADFDGVPRSTEQVALKRELNGTAAIASLQGYRRTMEDAAVIATVNLQLKDGKQPATLFGVFDGHEGSECAEYLKRYVANFLETEFTKPFPAPVSDDVKIFNICKRLFVYLGEDWRGKKSKSKSTACICLHIGNDLWVANVGDSRAFLLVNGELVGMSVDANPSDPNFARGVLKRGGMIVHRMDSWPRVGRKGDTDGYAMARAVGHPETGWGIHARAKVTRYTILPDQEVVLAMGTDGWFNMGSTRKGSETILQHIKHNPTSIARILVETAFQACQVPQMGDNITALVAKLQWKYNQE